MGSNTRFRWKFSVVSTLLVVAIFAATWIAAGSTTAWMLATWMGEEKLYVLLSVIVYMAVSRELGLLLVASIITNAWLNVSLKYTFNLPRPPKNLWKAPASGPGFPSGHTQVSTGFWTTLSLEKREMASVAAALVSLIGLSRVMLGVHYPIDVAGGYILGAASGAAVWLLRDKLSEARWLALFSAFSTALFSVLYLYTGQDVLLKLTGVSLALPIYGYVKARLPDMSRSLKSRVIATIALLAIVFLLLEGVSLIGAMVPLAYVPGYFVVFLLVVVGPGIYRYIG